MSYTPPQSEPASQAQAWEGRTAKRPSGSYYLLFPPFSFFFFGLSVFLFLTTTTTHTRGGVASLFRVVSFVKGTGDHSSAKVDPCGDHSSAKVSWSQPLLSCFFVKGTGDHSSKKGGPSARGPGVSHSCLVSCCMCRSRTDTTPFLFFSIKETTRGRVVSLCRL